MKFGFTLLELIIVIIIISLISGIFVYLIFTDTNSKFAQYTREEMDEIKEALLGFYRDCDQFPIGLADLETLPDETHFSGPASYRRSKWNGPYIQDKFDDDGYTRDAWNTSYVYSYTSGNTCSLTSYGANRTDDSGSGDDIVYTITAVEIEEEKKKNVQDELDIIQKALTDYFRATGENPSSIDDLFEWEVLNLHFDEGSGTTVTDYSGIGNNGTLVNEPTWDTGKVDMALDFDGTDDYVNCGNDASLGVGENVTFEFWINRKGAGSTGDTDTIIANRKNYWVRINRADRKIVFESAGSNGTWSPDAFSSSSIEDDEWYHIAIVRTSSTHVKFYIDGVFDNEDDTYASEFAANTVYLGSWSGSTHHFNGLIDELRIYRVALSEDEIRRHYENPGYPRSYFDLHDYTYKYDEWETEYKFRTATVSGTTYRFFYSCGPDREDDSGKDDDILPRGLEWLQSSL